jgi:hypothetical protein
MQDGFQNHLFEVAGVLVTADDPLETCPICSRSMYVQKTVRRNGLTLTHGSFRVRETVRICASRCRHEGSRVVHRPATLACLIPPGSVVGYDVMVHIGLERFVHHRQRDEIRAGLEKDHGIVLSSGEISDLGRRFLVYLEALHREKAPALRAAMEADGGWPLHIDATGEDGRGTLLVAFSGWRRWVLGAWKVPTERSDVILPRLDETAALFDSPCAIMRDLGRAVTEAAEQFVHQLASPIPVLACHQHFLRDVGTDLLREGHDKLRGLFRRVDIRKDIRAFVRKLGRCLGKRIHETRVDIRAWLDQSVQDLEIPEGAAGIAVVRALAQWILDFSADGNNQGFPFDLPYLDLYVRCLHIRWAVDGFLRKEPADAKVKKFLARLQKILAPMDCDVPPFAQVPQNLDKRANIFAELRTALRLAPKSSGRSAGAAAPADALQTANEFEDIRAAVAKLSARLKKRRPERGPAKDIRQAIDIVLTHLDRHGQFLWGHAIATNEETGRVRLVDRTNNVLEAFFHGMKHGERRRSGRKILTQDFERLPAATALAINLTRPDYVAILCGSLEQLPKAFAKLDEGNRAHSLPARTGDMPTIETETASMTLADKRLIRLDQMEKRIVAAGH